MLTLAHARTLTDYSLAWTSQDIQQALENCRKMMDAGHPYDAKRASEYADELCIVAQVRRERMARPCCPSCGQVLP